MKYYNLNETHSLKQKKTKILEKILEKIEFKRHLRKRQKKFKKKKNTIKIYEFTPVKINQRKMLMEQLKCHKD